MPNNGNATPITPNDSGSGRPQVDVVGLGLNAMDYITLVPHFPEPQKKTPISAVRLEPGGQVATALTTCSRLGLTTRYIGSVGSDDLGRTQLESLRTEDIDVSGVRVIEGVTSQMAIALIEEGVGERTLIWHRDPRLTFPPDEVSRAVITSARILHLDGRDSHAALRAAQLAKQAQIPVVIDIDQIYDETTVQLLALVDYLIAAEEFTKELTGQDDPDAMIQALSKRFTQAVTGITLGAGGAIFMIDGTPERSKAFEVDVLDTTGAGDVFHGAFIYGVLKNWELRKTIRFAHAAAAMKCRQYGARTGIPRLPDIEAFLK
jgi:sulfofructose kinase